jgi:glycosyltransferase 2 family protein
MRDAASLLEQPARPAASMTREGPSVAGPRESAKEIGAPAGSARKVSWFLVRLAIAGGLLAYLVRSGGIDWRALSRPFTAWPIALAAVALVLIDVSLNALRLSWLFRPHGLHLSWSKSFQVTMVSFFFAQFLPGATGGDLARLFYVAKDYKGLRSEIVTVSLFDRMIGMLSLLIMPLLVAPAFTRVIGATPALRALLVAAAALAAILVAGLTACLFYQSLMERLARTVFGFLPWRNWPTQVIRTIASYRHDLGTVAAALGISVLANSLLLIVMLLAVFVLNPAGLDFRMCLIIPLGFIVNCLPFTPGGLGVGETAFNSLFAVVGLSGGAEALLCWRVWTALVRLLGLVFYLRGIERVFGHHAADTSNAAPAARP